MQTISGKINGHGPEFALSQTSVPVHNREFQGFTVVAEETNYLLELDTPEPGLHQLQRLKKDHIGGVRWVIGVDRSGGERWILSMPQLQDCIDEDITKAFTANGSVYLRISRRDADKYKKFIVEVDTRLHPAIEEMRVLRGK